MTARITERFRVEEAGETREGRYCVRLLETLEYRVGSEDSDEVIRVPVGFETDFASIPWGLWNLFPRSASGLARPSYTTSCTTVAASSRARPTAARRLT